MFNFGKYPKYNYTKKPLDHSKPKDWINFLHIDKILLITYILWKKNN